MIFRTYGASREDVRLALEAENIEARPVWKPMHLQPVFDPQITQITRINGRPRGMDFVFHRAGKKAQNTQRKKKYRARVVGGEVAEDLFERGVVFAVGDGDDGWGFGSGD